MGTPRAPTFFWSKTCIPCTFTMRKEYFVSHQPAEWRGTANVGPDAIIVSLDFSSLCARMKQKTEKKQTATQVSPDRQLQVHPTLFQAHVPLSYKQ